MPYVNSENNGSELSPAHNQSLHIFDFDKFFWMSAIVAHFEQALQFRLLNSS